LYEGPLDMRRRNLEVGETPPRQSCRESIREMGPLSAGTPIAQSSPPLLLDHQLDIRAKTGADIFTLAGVVSQADRI